MGYLGASEQELSGRLSQLGRQLHGLAASMAQMKKGYEATGDPRYVQGARNILPLYETTLKNWADVSRQLGSKETPTQFMKVLSDFSEWATSKVIQPIVEGAAQTVQALPTIATKAIPAVAGAVALYFLWQSGVLRGLGARKRSR